MSRRRITWRGLATAGLWLVFGAWSLLLLAWLTLHWGILPHVDDWRSQVETHASASLGVPVHIGHIEVQTNGWVPKLRLDDVALVDAQGHEALRLPHVDAALSVRSLLAFNLRFEQLLIEGARLEVRRDAEGRLFVAGLQVKGASDEGSDAATDWFFAQHEFAIRHGSVRWVDERGQAPPLELADVEIVIRNSLAHHALRIDATPPPAWGERFTLEGRFSQPLLARNGDWKRWNGSVYAQLPRADVSELRQHVALPFELSRGQGALRAWIDVVAGEPKGITADVALNGVSLRLQKGLDPIDLAQLQGRFTGLRDKTGVHLAARDFSFTTGSGQQWPKGNLQLAWLQAQDQPARPVTGGDFSADRLDLGMMADVAGRLPLGEPVRKLLARLAPQGQVQGLTTRWDGPVDAPRHYQLKAHLSGVSIAAAASAEPHTVGRPGWRNAQIDLGATESGGTAALTLDDGALEFPGVFAEAVVPLDRFHAQLAWHIEAAKPGAGDGLPAVELKVQDARFANADAEGELDATWRTGTGVSRPDGSSTRFPGLLDMTGKLTRGKATRVARYLPLGIPDSARSYVTRAILAGQIDSASFRVKGGLSQFPFFNARDGEFRIVGQVSGVNLAYVPPEAGAPPAWPAFDNVAGELVFDRNAMEIHHATASVMGYELSQIEAGIRTLSDKPVLTVDGQGQGALADALRYVGATPIADASGQALAGIAVTGASDLKLSLTLPLFDLSRTTVRGAVGLAGNDLKLRPDVPMLAATRGRVEFTQKGFTLRNVGSHALGGDMTIDGGTQADGATRVAVQGMASADALRKTSELPALARIAASMSGQTTYRLMLGLVRGHPEFALTSPLTGMALDLPAPLKKDAETTLPLRLAVQLAPDDLHDTLRVELGSLVTAQYQRDLSGDAPRVTSGAIAVAEALPPATAAVAANLNLGVFDADVWRTLVAGWTGGAGVNVVGNGTAGSVAATGAIGNGGNSGTSASVTASVPLADAYMPHDINLRAKELHIGGRRLDDVVAGVAALPASDPGWKVNVVARQLSGDIELRLPANGPGRVSARLARLLLPPSEVQSVETLLDQAPTSVPALDIVVDDFELRGKKLGKLEIQAVNRGTEWRLSKFNLGVPEAQLQASGHWGANVGATGAGAGRRRMVLDFKLDVSDAGALLTRLEMPGALKGGKGRMQGSASWQGSPFSLDYPSLGGQLDLSLDDGQFLKAGSNAAKLLGVLSLQSLPRRLSFDFRDLFEEGFAFDHVSGNVQIKDGVASTNNLRMRGLQAAVLMEGDADIEHETQDLRVIVVPEINAGTASLAYAAINPAIGLGTFVAQLFLRKPLMQASTREFHISGTWDDPKVDRVERKLLAPLPDMEATAPDVAADAAASAPLAH